LSRYRIVVLLAVALGRPGPLRAQEPPPIPDLPDAVTTAPGNWPDALPVFPAGPECQDGQSESFDNYPACPGFTFDSPGPHGEYLPILKYLGLRHSYTHGRNVGRGCPLVGTSWLNRPYYVGGEVGGLWLTRPIHDDVTSDDGAFGGFFLGWDRDPYWGAELRFDWANPEFANRNARDAARTDSLFEWNYSLLYYPWGDAAWRPYWRAGIGDTYYDVPLDDGSRHDQWMLTFPLGFGVKYPVRRWLAARVEVCDHLGVGHYRLNAQNNLTLTFGLEWRFGAHPRSYWPWNPSRHIW
jgi:hypothetical protein